MRPQPAPAIESVDAADPLVLLERLRAALSGGPALRPYAGAPPALPPHDPGDLPQDLVLAVGTSGSTGEPKLALHDAASLRTSAAATYAALNGPGQWLLAIPAQHIAGLQVLSRSILADTTPVVMNRSHGFTAPAFAHAAKALGHHTTYTSLVPTQVRRLLADPAGIAALQGFSAILVGGSAVPATLREQAQAAGIRLVATYGMSESAGGCVYDARPLPDVRLAIDEDGRIHLGGPVIAHGYLGRPRLSARSFTVRGGIRWFATDDLGQVGADGLLQVHGRIDDVITTGGLKVHPRLVEDAALAAFPDLDAAVAVGIPDPEWGHVIALAVVGENSPSLARLREHLRARLPAYALPRRLDRVPALPERGPGKPDRRAIAAMMDNG